MVHSDVVVYEMWSEDSTGKIQRESLWDTADLDNALHAVAHCNKYNKKFQEDKKTYFVAVVTTTRTRLKE